MLQTMKITGDVRSSLDRRAILVDLVQLTELAGDVDVFDSEESDLDEAERGRPRHHRHGQG